MVYTLRLFSSKCSLFHNSNVFGSCIIHILYTGCAKIKKINNSNLTKRLILSAASPRNLFRFYTLLSRYPKFIAKFSEVFVQSASYFSQMLTTSVSFKRHSYTVDIIDARYFMQLAYL